jgi:hypothetical protein
MYSRAFTRKQLMRRDYNRDKHISGRSAVRAGAALSAQLYGLTVINTCRNGNSYRNSMPCKPDAAAILTRTFNNLSASVTCAALFRHLH